MTPDIYPQTSDERTNLFLDPTAKQGYTRAIRSQADNLGDQMSAETATHIDPEDFVTRQEFAEESDINYILQRYTGGRGRIPMYEENDYTLDLQTALTAAQFLKEANLKAPDELASKYPTPNAIIEGINSGNYQKDLEELQYRKNAETHEQTIRAMSKDIGTEQTPESKPKA